MRNRLPLNAIAITGREKKPAGIDFDIVPTKKREKKVKEEQPELFEQVYSDAHYEEYRKNKDKNLFEEVIEKMMVESCMDETFKPYIDEIREIVGKKLPKHKKRFAILCTLDKNRNLLRKAKVFNNIPVSKMEHIKDYVKILRQYVKVSEVEKKKFGEVMTPIELVTEMLNKLPKNVWSNPNLKWLDPCNGVGPFAALVVAGLMKGLANWEPDEEKRFRHIISNMVYVCELQPKNMFLWMCMMDPRDEHDMNIYCGSFLDAGFDKHMKEVWGVEKFDIIVGNPPYQDIDNKRLPLWQLFTKKTIDFLVKNGYLCFVHPSGWRKPNHELLDLFKRKNLIYLNINSQEDGIKVFKAGTRFDYYLLNNSDYAGTTTIIDEDNNLHKIDIQKLNFLPHSSYNLLQDITCNKTELVIIHSRSLYGNDKKHMSKINDDIFKYPCVYSTPCKKDPTFLYSNEDKGHFGVKKVIIGKASPENCFYDDGKYGVTNNCFAIVVEDEQEGNFIVNAIKSSKFTKFVNNCKWAGYSFEHEVFESLKKDFWKEFI